MHLERCANCRKVHTPGKFTAVYIKKRYFCRPSCANDFHSKPLKTDRFSGALISTRETTD